MKTRREFLASAAAAAVAVGMVGVAAPAVAARSDRIVNIHLQPTATNSQIIICSANDKQHVEKFIVALRDIMWTPESRNNSTALPQYISYKWHVERSIVYNAETTGVMLRSSFLFSAKPDMPELLLKHGIRLSGDRRTLNRFKANAHHNERLQRRLTRVDDKIDEYTFG